MIYPIKNIGLIPDGNRRWANKHQIPYEIAYKKSMDVLLTFIEDAVTMIPDLESIVVYMMSRKNLERKRPDLESVLLSETKFCQHGLVELANKLKIKVISVGLSNLKNSFTEHINTGLVDNFINAFDGIQKKTGHNRGQKIFLLAGFDPLDEINQVLKKKDIVKLDLNDLIINVNLDLIIRTAGEYRISNFVPLQSGYAELIVLDKYFQDFTADDLQNVIDIYHSRHRRFGE